MVTKSERLEIRVGGDILKQVDEWRGNQPDKPSRSEAARRLMISGLQPLRAGKIKLTDGETLITALLCDMHRARTDPSRAELDPLFIERAISDGHHWAIEFKYQGLFPRRSDNPKEVSEVFDFLDMWSFIEEAHETLPQSAKDRIEAEARYFGDCRFPGFDGNNEGHYLSIARFLTGPLERYERFEKRNLNSHAPTVEAYRRMYRLFEPMRATLIPPRKLNTAQIIQLLQAAE